MAQYLSNLFVLMIGGLLVAGCGLNKSSDPSPEQIAEILKTSELKIEPQTTKAIYPKRYLSLTVKNGTEPFKVELVSGKGSLSELHYTFPDVADSALIKITDAHGKVGYAVAEFRDQLKIDRGTNWSINLANCEAMNLNVTGGYPPYRFDVSGGTSFDEAKNRISGGTKNGEVVVTDAEGNKDRVDVYSEFNRNKSSDADHCFGDQGIVNFPASDFDRTQWGTGSYLKFIPVAFAVSPTKEIVVAGMHIPKNKIVSTGSWRSYVDLNQAEDSGGIELAITKYDLSGAIVKSFGTDGTVFLGKSHPALKFSRPDAVTILPNGKIVVAGSALTTDNKVKIVLVLLNADGTLDDSFGENGVSLIGEYASSVDNITEVFFGIIGSRILTVTKVLPLQKGGMLLQTLFQTKNDIDRSKSEFGIQLSGGKIYATGTSILALTEAGALDSQFAQNGELVLPKMDRSGKIEDIALTSDNQLLILESSSFETKGKIHKYSLLGKPVSSFGKKGVLLILDPNYSQRYGERNKKVSNTDVSKVEHLGILGKRNDEYDQLKLTQIAARDNDTIFVFGSTSARGLHSDLGMVGYIRKESSKYEMTWTLIDNPVESSAVIRKFTVDSGDLPNYSKEQKDIIYTVVSAAGFSSDKAGNTFSAGSYYLGFHRSPSLSSAINGGRAGEIVEQVEIVSGDKDKNIQDRYIVLTTGRLYMWKK